MKLEDALLAVLTVLALPNWAVALILAKAAMRKPRIRFLTVYALWSVLVALVIGGYVVAVLNARFDYLISADAMRIVLRALLVVFALFPFWWLFLFLTGRFLDESAGEGAAPGGEVDKGPEAS